MAQTPAKNSIPSKRGAEYLFGVPLGDLGWFTSLVMALASGFVAFFASTFLAIVTILFLNNVARKQLDFTLSYRAIGLPIGLAVGLAAFSYLAVLWIKRQFRRA